LVAAGLILAAVAWLPGWLIGRWQADAGPGCRGRVESLLCAARLAPADPYLREDLYWAWLSQQPPDLEKARPQLVLAEKLNPFDAVYLEWEAELAAHDGFWDQASEAAGRAAALEPNYLSARMILADSLWHLGQPGKARAEVLEVCRRSRALESVLNHGRGYESLIVRFRPDRYRELARRVGVSGDCAGAIGLRLD
jgi:hypothetical protein